MKKIKQAIVLVDVHRRPERRRNTAGRYIVSAKSEKEAVELVQKAVGFGSVQFYYWQRDDSFNFLKYKEIKRMEYDGETNKWSLEEPRHACSPSKGN